MKKKLLVTMITAAIASSAGLGMAFNMPTTGSVTDGLAVDMASMKAMLDRAIKEMPVSGTLSKERIALDSACRWNTGEKDTTRCAQMTGNAVLPPGPPGPPGATGASGPTGPSGSSPPASPPASPPPSCSGQTVSWTSGSNSCSGYASTTSYGGSVGVSDSTPSYTGNAVYQCTTSGAWSKLSGTCSYQSPPASPPPPPPPPPPPATSCPSGSFTAAEGCYYVWSQTPAGQTITVPNLTAGRTGNVTGTCGSNGAWTNSPYVCKATDVCPNLAGTQTSVPSGYTLSGGQCVQINLWGKSKTKVFYDNHYGCSDPVKNQIIWDASSNTLTLDIRFEVKKFTVNPGSSEPIFDGPCRIGPNEYSCTLTSIYVDCGPPNTSLPSYTYQGSW